MAMRALHSFSCCFILIVSAFSLPAHNVAQKAISGGIEERIRRVKNISPIPLGASAATAAIHAATANAGEIELQGMPPGLPKRVP